MPNRCDLCANRHRVRSQGNVVRLRTDIRKGTVFIGTLSGEDFTPAATAFLLNYKEEGYLVTARHVVSELGDDPFAVRMNGVTGGCVIAPVDPTTSELQWHFSSDADVDIAVMEWPSAGRDDVDNMYLPTDVILSTEDRETYKYGIGSPCYAVGLFSHVSGKARNVPVVHTGNLSLMAGEEKVPIADWDQQGGLKYVDAHLVELSNLRGLSGAPVFVRPSVDLVSSTERFPLPSAIFHSATVFLLGVWSGSWEAMPTGRKLGVDRVPVGMGSVTPVERLVEILDSTALRKCRELASACGLD